MQSSSFRAGITMERSDRRDVDPLVTEKLVLVRLLTALGTVSRLFTNHRDIALGAGWRSQRLNRVPPVRYVWRSSPTNKPIFAKANQSVISTPAMTRQMDWP